MIAADRVRCTLLVPLACALASIFAAGRGQPTLPSRRTGRPPNRPKPPTGTVTGHRSKSDAEKGSEADEIGMPKQPPSIVEVRTDLAIWSFVVFLVLLAILTKFAWGPIVAGLAKREQGIEENIAAAKRANEEAKKVLADYDKQAGRGGRPGARDARSGPPRRRADQARHHRRGQGGRSVGTAAGGARRCASPPMRLSRSYRKRAPSWRSSWPARSCSGSSPQQTMPGWFRKPSRLFAARSASVN